jgi:drug/metabolite transporter (DMT)-like permease
VTETKKQSAGAFDVRNVIGGLIGFDGVVLLLVAFFGQDEPEKTGGVDANLWAGLAMLVFGLAFALWSRLRPVVVQPGAHVSGEERPPGH